MKKFESPKMMVIKLASDNVVATSGYCAQNICHGYDCPDCPTICTGIYHCNTFKCGTY